MSAQSLCMFGITHPDSGRVTDLGVYDCSYRTDNVSWARVSEALSWVESGTSWFYKYNFSLSDIHARNALRSSRRTLISQKCISWLTYLMTFRQRVLLPTIPQSLVSRCTLNYGPHTKHQLRRKTPQMRRYSALLTYQSFKNGLICTLGSAEGTCTGRI